MFRYDCITRSALRFEYLSQKVWPLLRPLSKTKVAPRCRQCTISSRVPGITLTDGVCNRCHEFNAGPHDSAEQRWTRSYVQHQAEGLDALLSAYQGKGPRRWDALVLFSGGKDSVYMVYRLRREYPDLRLLAVTWNNGFYSEIALGTAADAAKKLDLEHMILKPRTSVYKNLYRETLMRVNQSGSYGTVDRFDGTLNQHLGMRLGAELEIPLVLSGVDWAQAELMGSWDYFEISAHDMLSGADVQRMQRRSGLAVSEVLGQEDADLYWDGSKWPVERVPRFLLPLVAWRPDKSVVARELEQRGLILSGHSSPIVTNNQVLSIMSVIDIKKIGYCSFEPEFADMIRIKRSNANYWRNAFEALEYVVNKGLYKDRAFMQLLGRLDLTLDDVGLA